ncbi:MAG: amidase [Deltaproteobacteria bacterium]|nr:amidase [Deltaproteobacteria bacterium]
MTKYSRDPVKAPRVKGLALKAFVKALESPVGGVVVDKIMADSGFVRFRELDAGTASPQDFPLPQPSPAPKAGKPHEMAAAVVDAVAASTPSTGPETVSRFVAAYREGVSPVDVAARIEKSVQRFAAEGMGFFIARKPEELARDAAASAQRHKEKKTLSVLDGIPFVIKDELDVEGYATTLGTSWRNAVATTDSTIAARLKAAGALLVGKGNMNEIGINPIGLNPHWGVCRNPWDKTRICGGSSSASAATVAAGLAPISIGADGGGSIRIPASLCGVVGLKATHGRIPETGVPPLCWTPGHAGPFGRTVADVAAAYAVIAGSDGHDQASLAQPAPSLEDFAKLDVKGLRVGVTWPWLEDADKDVVARTKEAIKALTDRGCVVVEVPPVDLNRILWAHATIILSEMATAMRGEIAKGIERFAYDTRTNLAIAQRFSAMDYVHALRHRHAITQETLEIFKTVDVIATPTTATTAPPIPEDTLPDGDSNLPVVDGLMRFVRIGNLVGYPAISVPCGFDSAGLPVGFHLMGRAWEEHTLLRLARVVELASEQRQPKGVASALS